MKKQKSTGPEWTDHLKAIFWIIITGVVPLAGVWLYNWSAYELILIYVVETWVIGIFNVAKLLMAESGWKSFEDGGTASFFCIHYGIFIVVQTILILVFLDCDESFSLRTFLLSIALLSVSHLVCFLLDYVRPKRYLHIKPDMQMFAPYGRVLVQQFLAIGGGLLAGGTEKNTRTFLVLLVLLKMSVDYVLFLLKPKEQTRSIIPDVE